MITCGVISKKKKNRSTHVWLQDLCSFRPENYTKCVSEQVLTFFFFFRDHPCFIFFRTSWFTSTIKSRTEFERPDFVIKIIEKPINLASCKVAIHCPDFCFSRYGNPMIKRYPLKVFSIRWFPLSFDCGADSF